MRVVRWLIVVAILTSICWLFPLFHIVPLKTVMTEKTAATFNPTQFAEMFWTNQLLPALDKAVKTDVLLSAVQSDSAKAKAKFARHVGLGEAYFYFVSGIGRVTAVSDDEISLAVTDGRTNAEISLQTGLIFGNALRDGTDLLNVSDYPDSQNFNGIGEALNHIAETQVQPKLREQAKVGAKIFFAGCAEVGDESTDLKPLKVIPIQTKAE